MRAVVEIRGERYELYRATPESVAIHRELGARVFVVYEGGPKLAKTTPASSPDARARRARGGGGR